MDVPFHALLLEMHLLGSHQNLLLSLRYYKSTKLKHKFSKLVFWLFVIKANLMSINLNVAE